MAFNKVLAAAWMAAWLAGCAQGRDPSGGHADAPKAQRVPVATQGPDDVLPFTTAPGKMPTKQSSVHVGAPSTAPNADDGQGKAAPATR